MDLWQGTKGDFWGFNVERGRGTKGDLFGFNDAAEDMFHFQFSQKRTVCNKCTKKRTVCKDVRVRSLTNRRLTPCT